MGNCIDCGKPSKMERCYECYKKKQNEEMRFCACGSPIYHDEKTQCPDCWRSERLNNNLYAMRTQLDELCVAQTGKKVVWVKANEKTKEQGHYEMQYEAKRAG